jgi:hypothetical protein
VRLPPVSSRKRSSRRAAICSGDSDRTRAAASSIANGMPSSRWQTLATAVPLRSVSMNDGSAAEARSMNRRIVSKPSR